MYGYIYKTTNLVNGKIYIGQKKSKKFLGQMYLGSGTILKKAIDKYGSDNFKVELLVECQSQKELDENEKQQIAINDARNVNIGYNINEGGFGGGGPRTEETKAKISRWNRNKTFVNDGKVCIKIDKKDLQKYLDSGYIYGPLPFTRTNEFKEKVSKTNTGKIAVSKNEHKTWISKEFLSEYLNNGYIIGWIKNKKTYQWKSIKGTGKYRYIYKDNKYLKVAESELEKYLDDGWIMKGPSKTKKRVFKRGYKLSDETRKKLSVSHLGNKLSEETKKKLSDKMKGKIVVHKDDVNRYINKDELNVYIESGWKRGAKRPHNPRSRKVVCFETNEIFDCISRIHETTKIEGVRRCLKGKASSTCGGYHWYYYGDESRREEIEKIKK